MFSLRMRYWCSVLLLTAACATGAPAEPAGSVATSDVISFQGPSVHGAAVPGLTYQSVALAGATWGGSALGNGTALFGTAIFTWRDRGDGHWEQRWPDRTCVWNGLRTTNLGCTAVNLAASPSPLAGTQFQATFLDASGAAVTQIVEIGTATNAQGAVLADTTVSAFPLFDSYAASNNCAVVALGDSNPANASAICSAEAGCRVNCDVWQYDVRLPNRIDGDGQPIPLCPGGARATALAGTWDAQGTFHASTTQFSFTCGNGAVEKCVRWGYRPWDSALKSDATTIASLAPYHQTCIRAAMADYCGDGRSFTSDGTVVDVYDRDFSDPDMPTVGFITASHVFDLEAMFDSAGAYHVRHTRHPELAALSDPQAACPGRFVANGTGWDRDPDVAPWPQGPSIAVHSGPACSHGELTPGRFLDEDCNQTCLPHVYSYQRAFNPTTHAWSYPWAGCFNPAGNGWTSGCVAAAQAVCEPSAMMTSHSECVTGVNLRPQATQCTALVELQRPSCGASFWDVTCVALANSLCTGGRESHIQPIGFCGTSLVDVRF
jgi:hypothetical protein